MKPRAITLCAAAATVLFGVVSAHAGPCTADIVQLESAIRGLPSNPLAGPTGRQTIGAQLGHQPTPDSVRAAEQEAQAGFAAAVARAKALDEEDRSAECAQAVRDAKLIIGME
jgi:hypothetical protein